MKCPSCKRVPMAFEDYWRRPDQYSCKDCGTRLEKGWGITIIESVVWWTGIGAIPVLLVMGYEYRNIWLTFLGLVALVILLPTVYYLLWNACEWRAPYGLTGPPPDDFIAK
jgi:hypothetical protein